MPRRQDGWPLGLRPLMNSRLVFGFSAGSSSFNTLLTASPNPSTLFSSDLDSQSTGSFYKEKSKTLGSLIGDREKVMLSRRRPKPWLFSLCSDLSTTDAVVITTNRRATSTPSLSHFLEAERTRVSTTRPNNQSRKPLLPNKVKTDTHGGHVIGLPSLFPSIGQLIRW